MAEYFVQGKKGAGKSITAVGRIKEYLLRGRICATNLDLNLESLISPHDKECRVYRIPDQPRIEHLEMLPIANESYDEELNGIMVFDECATWFNARSWNDKARKPVIDWLLHARKRGWDVYYLVQDVSAIDSQARQTMMEHCVTVKRTDRLNIPGIGTLFKLLTGYKLPMPKGHAATVVYTDSDLVVDRWFMRGDELYKGYDTKQIFRHPDDPSTPVGGVASMLPPYYTHGYRMLRRNKEFYMRLGRLYFRKLREAIYFGSGALTCGLVAFGFFAFTNDADAVESKPPQVAQVHDTRPEYSRLTLVSYALIHKTDQNGYVIDKAFDDYWITDGNSVFTIRDLKQRGYRHKFISDCFQVVTDQYGNDIPVNCSLPEIERSGGLLSDATQALTDQF